MQRTTRTLLAALGVVLGLFLLAPAAHAQEGGGTSGTEAQGARLTEENDCFVKAVEENSGDNTKLNDAINACKKAPNPLLPATNEIIWAAIGFAIVFGFLAKVGYPTVKKGMDARTERIRADLDAAESARNEAESVLAEYRTQLQDARNESGRIIEEARQQADALKREQEQRLQSELAEMRARAQADVASARAQAIADLRTEVANLAIGAAEVVVQRNLDRQTQTQLVESYINQVASRSN